MSSRKHVRRGTSGRTADMSLPPEQRRRRRRQQVIGGTPPAQMDHASGSRAARQRRDGARKFEAARNSERAKAQ